MAPREIELIKIEGVDIALGNLVRRLASSGRVILPAFLEGLRFRGKDAAGSCKRSAPASPAGNCKIAAAGKGNLSERHGAV